MGTKGPTAFVAAMVLWLAGVGMVAAQTVPLPPRPPHAKSTTGQAQRPPAAVPSAPNQPQPPAQAAPSTSSGSSFTLFPGLKLPFGSNSRPDTPQFDAAQRALAEKVSNYLTSVRTLVGDFVQVGPDGRRVEGQFYLQKPGRVRFEYQPPSPIELISDGTSVVVRDRKLATQDLYPLSQTPLRFLLADRIDLLRDTNLVGVYADEVFVTIVIEEKQVIGTHRLMVMFGAKDMQLRQWTVTDPQGYDTTVAVYNLDTKTQPDPGLFKINYERMLQ